MERDGHCVWFWPRTQVPPAAWQLRPTVLQSAECLCTVALQR